MQKIKMDGIAISLSSLNLQEFKSKIYTDNKETTGCLSILKIFLSIIRRFESNRVVDLESSFRVVVPNYKPDYFSRLDCLNSGDLQKCYVIVKIRKIYFCLQNLL